jgi:hypothetical protein
MMQMMSKCDEVLYSPLKKVSHMYNKELLPCTSKGNLQFNYKTLNNPVEKWAQPSQVWWYTPMNPSTTEVKAGGLRVPGQPDYTEKPCLKNKKQQQKWARTTNGTLQKHQRPVNIKKILSLTSAQARMQIQIENMVYSLWVYRLSRQVHKQLGL